MSVQVNANTRNYSIKVGVSGSDTPFISLRHFIVISLPHLNGNHLSAKCPQTGRHVVHTAAGAVGERNFNVQLSYRTCIPNVDNHTSAGDHNPKINLVYSDLLRVLVVSESRYCQYYGLQKQIIISFSYFWAKVLCCSTCNCCLLFFEFKGKVKPNKDHIEVC